MPGAWIHQKQEHTRNKVCGKTCSHLDQEQGYTVFFNRLQIAEATAFGKTRVCTGNSTLRILDVASNGIGDFGAQAIAEGLKYNTTLLKLDLSSNTIDEKGTGASGVRWCLHTRKFDNDRASSGAWQCERHMIPTMVKPQVSTTAMRPSMINGHWICGCYSTAMRPMAPLLVVGFRCHAFNGAYVSLNSSQGPLCDAMEPGLFCSAGS
eukprot:scaffold312365_cov21-Tisochrysis_lutea.AAC.1